MKNFKWTDALVREYQSFKPKIFSDLSAIEQFKVKKEKQWTIEAWAELHERFNGEPKKEYEILEFTHEQSGTKFTVQPNGNFVSERYKEEEFELKDLLHNEIGKVYSITKVKRLSDGEVFTIGDKVLFHENSKIDRIFYSNGSILCDLEHTSLCMPGLLSLGYTSNVNINSLSKIKQPLFTTEDGVKIFKGDKYFSVKDFKINGIRGYDAQSVEKYFSTTKAAEEWIIMNKPSLSLSELSKLYTSSPLSPITIHNIEPLKKIVREKLTNP